MYGIVPTIVPWWVIGACVAIERLLAGIGAADARQAEVEHLDAAVVRHHHVAGLQIAMRDLFLMRGRERIGERHRDLEEARHRHPARRHQVAQRASIDQLHRQEADAVRFLGRVDGDDVRMIERRDRARFAIEAFEAAGLVGDIRRQDLQRDIAPKPRIARAIDLAHSAGAERGDDFVRGELLTGTEGHSREPELYPCDRASVTNTVAVGAWHQPATRFVSVSAY